MVRFNVSIFDIGSEIAQARFWEERGDEAARDKALMRALELIDLTIAVVPLKSRFREIGRFREVVCDWFYRKNVYAVTPLELENYCTQFVLA